MYDPVYELEHFGVPGMKWGVRRTPAQLGQKREAKLNRYKEKEIRKVEKRIAKIDKDWKKYDKKVKKTRVLNFVKVAEFDYYREEARKEIRAIKNMSYKDMKSERVELGKQLIKDMSTNFATALSSDFTPRKYDASRIKTDRRLQQGYYAKKKPNVTK